MRSRQVSLWVPPVLYMAAIFFVSAIPNLQGPPGVSDKIEHAAEYAGLTVLLVRALAAGRWGGVGGRSALAAALLSIGYALTDEWHQRFVTGRAADWLDVRADAAGAVVAAAALWACSIIRARWP